MTVYEKVRCNECDRLIDKRATYKLELYDTPWDNEPRIAYFCKHTPKEIARTQYNESCLDLLDDQSWSDFRYFECERCHRMVCEQNPSNGWHSQVRYLGEDEFSLCLRCYGEYILENGTAQEELEAGRLPGMFFSHDNHEPLEAGYGVVMEHVKVGDPEPVINKALELIESGYKVVIGYESMAIGGLEGYVTLFSKKLNYRRERDD